MFSLHKILFLVSLLFVALFNSDSIPTYLLNFKFFYHSSLFVLYMLSIHNLSAGAQNVTGAYVITMLVYRCLPNNYACLQVLVNNALTWQSSCVIANNARKTAKAKTAKAICPSIILKFTISHAIATNYRVT